MPRVGTTLSRPAAQPCSEDVCGWRHLAAVFVIAAAHLLQKLSQISGRHADAEFRRHRLCVCALRAGGAFKLARRCCGIARMFTRQAKSASSPAKRAAEPSHARKRRRFPGWQSWRSAKRRNAQDTCVSTKNDKPPG